MSRPNSLQDNALNLVICLKSRGMVSQLQTLIIHLNDPGREIFQVPGVFLNLLDSVSLAGSAY